MAMTLEQTESEPVAFPAVPDGLTEDAAALDSAAIWQRIEAYVAHRWSERDVTWVAEGPGEWVPPLTPAIITNTQVWSSAGEFELVELAASPLGGFHLPATGPYKFAGTVGGGSPSPQVPAAVGEAFRRLAEYMAQRPGLAGATFEQESIGDALSNSHRRSAAWLAMALQNSGAADLLRPFRRASC